MPKRSTNSNKILSVLSVYQSNKNIKSFSIVKLKRNQ